MDAEIKKELVKIETKLDEISKKFDELLEYKEIFALMKLSEESFREIFEDEEDLYSVEDLKVKFKWILKEKLF